AGVWESPIPPQPQRRRAGAARDLYLDAQPRHHGVERVPIDATQAARPGLAPATEVAEHQEDHRPVLAHGLRCPDRGAAVNPGARRHLEVTPCPYPRSAVLRRVGPEA